MTDNKRSHEVVQTADGSSTVLSAIFNEHYHSLHGALQESLHVFIENGLKTVDKEELRILEVGFGTGLNACLTLIESSDKNVFYHGVEMYPIDHSTVEKLNYFEDEHRELFNRLHTSPWETTVQVTDRFSILKEQKRVQDCVFHDEYDIVYYDAFGPGAQPELWTEDVLAPTVASIAEAGVLVTYCAQGEFKRILKRLNFKIEELPGPPGKRQMTRATKSYSGV